MSYQPKARWKQIIDSYPSLCSTCQFADFCARESLCCLNYLASVHHSNGDKAPRRVGQHPACCRPLIPIALDAERPMFHRLMKTYEEAVIHGMNPVSQVRERASQMSRTETERNHPPEQETIWT